MIRPTDSSSTHTQDVRTAPLADAAQAPRATPTSSTTPVTASTDAADVSVASARANVADARAGLQATLARHAGAGGDAGVETDAGAGVDSGEGEGATVSDEESYRQLIATDIRTAYGREANDDDYAYWLPKLQGPNDSGFVTSGKMNATEYWHRRLLGWQAGGADVATSGPYAGGGGPHGDVPAATDIVPGIPPGGVYNQASPERIDEIKRIINGDLQLAYGREANDEDYGYWLNKFLGENDSGFVTSGRMSSDEYWHRRLLGWQAGGADTATSGPFAYTGEDQGRSIPPVEIYRE